MANGLFNTQNNAAQVMMLMEAERAKRIRDAGAGMDPIVASMARAQAGMRESVGDLARAGAGLFGMKMPQDPRLSQAMKRDKDRNEMIKMLQGFAAPKAGEQQGVITEAEMRAGYAELMRRGYMEEANEFLRQAMEMAKEARSKKSLELQGTRVNLEGKRFALTEQQQKFNEEMANKELSLKKKRAKLGQDKFEAEKKKDAALLKKTEAQIKKIEAQIKDIESKKFPGMDAATQPEQAVFSSLLKQIPSDKMSQLRTKFGRSALSGLTPADKNIIANEAKRVFNSRTTQMTEGQALLRAVENLITGKSGTVLDLGVVTQPETR